MRRAGRCQRSSRRCITRTCEELGYRRLGANGSTLSRQAANREHALCLLQCRTVAVRPLRVGQLAEVLAVDFDMGRDGGFPKLNPECNGQNSTRPCYQLSPPSRRS